MKEMLGTSVGGFKVGWAVRSAPAGEAGSEELLLSLDPDFGQAPNPWRDLVNSAGDVEALLVRAGVPTDEARSLSPDLWERRWRGHDALRRSNDNVHDLRCVQSELKEQWGRLTELTPIQLVRQWIAFVAVVEVGYDDGWEYYGHELMTREYIAELCRRLPRWSEYFHESVAPWDERFRAATTEQSEPFFPPGDAGASAWWCYRAPRLWADESD